MRYHTLVNLHIHELNSMAILYILQAYSFCWGTRSIYVFLLGVLEVSIFVALLPFLLQKDIFLKVEGMSPLMSS